MYALVNIKVNNKIVKNASHLCIVRQVVRPDLCKIKYFSKNKEDIFVLKEKETFDLKAISFVLMNKLSNK